MSRDSMGQPRPTRRQVLRGLGVSVCLPWLASVPAAAGDGPSVQSRPPKRFAFIYSAHGYYMKDWWARGSGATMELGPLLQGLAPFRKDLVFCQDFTHRNTELLGVPHPGAMPQLLSGCKLLHSTSEIRAGTTLDQVIARSTERFTEIPSLNIAVDNPQAGVDVGMPLWYCAAISWISAQQPTNRIVGPRQAFNHLFVDRRQRAQIDRSVLDLVREDARALERVAAVEDRRRLDSFFTAVRDNERRIEILENLEKREGWRPKLLKPDLTCPELDGPVQSLSPPEPEKHMQALLDITALAFRMDKTRVATVMLDLDHATTHQLSHDAYRDFDKAKGGVLSKAIEVWSDVNRHRVGLFANFCKQLAEHDEGGERLLDNAILCFGSNTTALHSNGPIPMVMVGRAGGLPTGQVVGGEKRPYEERKMCSIYLSILRRMGVAAESFGDATAPHPAL